MKMKKFIAIFALFMLAFIFYGCETSKTETIEVGPDTTEAESDTTLRIVTTGFPPYDFARVVAGDTAEITMLLKPGAESHSFEPTPQDIISIQNCDLFVYVGGESDVWVENILESIDTSEITILPLMSTVEPVEEEIVEGMEEEEEEEAASEGEEEEEPEYDEHIWTSPANAKKIVDAIAIALSDLDPENAEGYSYNALEYTLELLRLDEALRDVVEESTRNTIVFGDRFPFRYLADTYGLEYYAAFPGCSTETEASAATVAFLVDKIKDEGIPVVFYIELSNEKMANAISEATGAKPMLLHACHNISKEDFDNGATYLELMNKNVEALREALK
jgi:zinc transport system substrate-binding protein